MKQKLVIPEGAILRPTLHAKVFCVWYQDPARQADTHLIHECGARVVRPVLIGEGKRKRMTLFRCSCCQNSEQKKAAWQHEELYPLPPLPAA